MDHRLPPELVDVVIDHLHNETRTLKACSLVCKAWTRTARHHLFDHPMKFNQIKLGALLQSNASSVVRLLRNVSLHGNTSIENVQFWESLPFSRLSASFRSLKTLRFYDIPWNRISPQARSSLLAPFVAVQVANLYLSGVTDHIMPYVTSAFPSLEYVFGGILLPSPSTNQNQEPPSFETRLPATLRAIQITSWGHLGAVLPRFLAVDNLPAIHTIALHNVKTADYDGINLLLAALGSSLQTFVCRPARFHPQSSAIDLSFNPSLRTINLGLSVQSSGTPWITQTLLSICSQTINTVVIVVYHANNPVRIGSEIHWESIDDILARPIFSSLTVVHLRAPGFGDFGVEICQALAPRLPQCRAQGVLRFGGLDDVGYPDFLLKAE